MKKFKLSNFTKGWIIGDFEPALVRTGKFEFGIKVYRQGDKDNKHFHKVADEFTVIISGKFKVNGEICQNGEIIWFQPYDISDFECLEEGSTVIIKVPSVKGDKYICE